MRSTKNTVYVCITPNSRFNFFCFVWDVCSLSVITFHCIFCVCRELWILDSIMRSLEILRVAYYPVFLKLYFSQKQSSVGLLNWSSKYPICISLSYFRIQCRSRLLRLYISIMKFYCMSFIADTTTRFSDGAWFICVEKVRGQLLLTGGPNTARRNCALCWLNHVHVAQRDGGPHCPQICPGRDAAKSLSHSHRLRWTDHLLKRGRCHWRPSREIACGTGSARSALTGTRQKWSEE